MRRIPLRSALLLCLVATLLPNLGCRKAEEAALPEFEVVLAGADGHGKTTLLAAMTRVLAERGLTEDRSYDDLAKASATGGVGVDYRAAGHRITLRDHGGHGQIMAALGSKVPAALVLVIGQAEGPDEQTRQQIAAAASAGKPPVAVFLSKGDLVDDEELRILVLAEIEQLLVEQGLVSAESVGTWEAGTYRPGQTLAFSGSALRALEGDAVALGAVGNLIDAVDRLAASN